jgi:diguanylate cyclase (GGDEF)-like protein/PAS domain S-box-containing protein
VTTETTLVGAESASAQPSTIWPPSVPRARGGDNGSELLQRAWRAVAETSTPSFVLATGYPGGPRVVWVNRGFCDLLGVDQSGVLGAGLTDCVALPGLDEANDDDWVDVTLALMRAGGGNRSATAVRLDGTLTQLQVRAKAIYSGPRRTPEPESWLVALHPMADRMGAVEAALRDSEERFTALAEYAPVGIVSSEAGLRLGYVNANFLELVGHPAYEVLGTGWLDDVAPEDVNALYAAAERVLSGTPAEVTLRYDTPDAGQRWLNLRLAPTTTPARGAGFVGVVEDVTERRAWAEKLVYQAQHDPLTGLANRRRIVEHLNELLHSKRVRDRNLGLLFLDLDGFKAVNDTFGHEAGDRVLIEVARRMQRTARDGDIVGRVAGDEFVVILRQVDLMDEAEAAARRYLDVLVRPHIVEQQPITVSASIGIALPGDDETPESMLRMADRLMYAAKASGSGRFHTVRMSPPAGNDSISNDVISNDSTEEGPLT